MGRPVIILAGGTGGAKLARGMLDLVGDDLVVIANTGDDVEIYGVHVSPDPDLVTFWLADRIGERGYGLRDDTFRVMDELRGFGVDVWFNLGDADLAWCIERSARTEAGQTPTQALAALARSIGVTARVLPMSDDPVRTRVRARGQWFPFQEFMIRERGEGPIDAVAYHGAPAASPTRDVLDAIAEARAIIIGPSNPVASIGPILSVPGITEALRAKGTPVVAVSPIVGGDVLKGPTAAFMESAGLTADAQGITRAYAGVVDAIVTDEAGARLGVPVRIADTLMADADGRRRVAETALALADEIGDGA